MKYHECNECKCRSCTINFCASSQCKVCDAIHAEDTPAYLNVTLVCRQYHSVEDAVRLRELYKGGKQL